MQHTRVLVIGAGISGLSAARMLKENGIEALILERESKPGGLIKCDVVDGHLFHRVGGHVFNTRVEKVANWFWSQFTREIEFLSAKRVARIYIKGLMMGYPIENYLYMLDEKTIREIVNELLDIEKGTSSTAKTHSNFEEFLISNFGTQLYELYFKPYNQKIWKTDLQKVSLPWLDGKLPMPAGREIILSNILRQEETKMVHSTFFYPLKNGSQFIADRLANGLNLKTGVNVESIERVNNNWVINGEWLCQEVVFTGDVRSLAVTMKGVSSETKTLLESILNLQSNGTSNLLCETDETNLSWLYLPDKTIPAHRVIYTGNFSPENQQLGRRKSCTVEFSGKTSVLEMKAALGNLPGNLKAIDYNYEPNSYVIQLHGDSERLCQLKGNLARLNFHLAGRFAEWEYYNMDKAIERAISVSESIITQ